MDWKWKVLAIIVTDICSTLDVLCILTTRTGINPWFSLSIAKFMVGLRLFKWSRKFCRSIPVTMSPNGGITSTYRSYSLGFLSWCSFEGFSLHENMLTIFVDREDSTDSLFLWMKNRSPSRDNLFLLGNTRLSMEIYLQWVSVELSAMIPSFVHCCKHFLYQNWSCDRWFLRSKW